MYSFFLSYLRLKGTSNAGIANGISADTVLPPEGFSGVRKNFRIFVRISNVSYVIAQLYPTFCNILS